MNTNPPEAPDADANSPSATPDAMRVTADADRRVGTISAAGALVGATAAGLVFPPLGIALAIAGTALAGYKLVSAENLERRARLQDERTGTLER